MTGAVGARAAPPGVDRALLERVRGELAERGQEATPALVARTLRGDGRVLGGATVLAVADTLRAELAGAGPLEPLLHLPGVSDVVVTGTAGGPARVWVDRGRGLEATPVAVGSEEAVRRLAVRLASSAGRRLDDAQPWVDARLPDGVRLHAVLAPLAVDGTCISLRVPPTRAFSLAELEASGAVAPDLAPVLDGLVAARCSLLVTGGTGSGKTTVLGTLLSLVPPAERLVLVEDSAELRPEHPHVVRLQARPPNVEGRGAVPVRELVRQALRMRPDRLVVGEVRGPEVVDLLAALNTGHEGGAGTVHANEPAALPARLEALAAPAGLGRDAVQSQVAAGLDAVVHVVRDRAGRRRVAEVGVVRSRVGAAEVVQALVVDARGALREGPGSALLARRLDRGRP